jgi:hypothetical protein
MRQAPRAWDSATTAWQERPSATVWEQEKTPHATGLLDAAGVPLYRVPETVPMGFKKDHGQ